VSIRFTLRTKCNDPEYRALPPDAKLLLEHLKDVCDPAGFLEWDPQRVRFELGLSPKRIERAIQALVTARRVADNGVRLWIPDHITEQRNWPLNPDNNSHKGIIRLLEERIGFDPRIGLLLSGEGLPQAFGAPSEGLFRDTSIGKGKGTSKGSVEEDLRFTNFWDLYPRKVAKKKACEAFAKAVKSDETFKAIMEGLRRHVGCQQWEKDGGQYVPYPATWLNQERWEDEVKPGQQRGARGRDDSEYEGVVRR